MNHLKDTSDGRLHLFFSCWGNSFSLFVSLSACGVGGGVYSNSLPVFWHSLLLSQDLLFLRDTLWFPFGPFVSGSGFTCGILLFL